MVAVMVTALRVRYRRDAAVCKNRAREWWRDAAPGERADRRHEMHQHDAKSRDDVAGLNSIP